MKKNKCFCGNEKCKESKHCRFCYIIWSKIPENNPNWKGGITNKKCKICNCSIGFYSIYCIKCSKMFSAEKIKHNVKYIKNFFKEQKCKLLTIKYINSHTKLKYKCICGNISKITFCNFKNGVRCRKCSNKNRTGSNNVNWNNSINRLQREKDRSSLIYKNLRLNIYKRDNFTCQCCQDNKGGNLVIHHLEGYHWCKSLRKEKFNIITLCKQCHDNFHKQYGYLWNTVYQFIIFMNNL